MIDRFLNKKIYTNNLNLYKEYFSDRNINLIRQYRSSNFLYPSAEQLKSIKTFEHFWSVGDRFYKLSYEYYGNVNDWWIIAMFNHKPTESHLKAGDVLYIPYPIEQITAIMKG